MKLAEDKLSLSSEEIIVSELASKMKAIPVQDLVKFFQDRQISFDRRVRMAAMRTALRPFVLKTRYECLTLDSRLNYRLLWFNVFSEYQMAIFFKQFDDEKMQNGYAEDLFKHIIFSLSEDDNNEKTLLELNEMADKFAKSVGKRIKIDPDKINQATDEIFVDIEGMLDGLEMKDFRPILYNSATKEQLVGLGKKYGISVPDKLSGDGLREYVRGMLEVKELLTSENEEIIKTGRVTDVKNLASQHNIKLAIELNKKETIEFILQRGETTKPLYVLPESESVYEMSIPANDDEKRYEKLLSEAAALEQELAAAKDDLSNLKGKEKEAMEKLIAEKEKEAERQNELLNELQQRLDAGEFTAPNQEEDFGKEKELTKKEIKGTALPEDINIKAGYLVLIILGFFAIAGGVFGLLFGLIK